MSKDIASLQIHLDNRFDKMDEKFTSKIENLETIVNEKFTTQEQKFENKGLLSKNEMLRAMYITSFVQIISIIGGIMALVKILK